MSAARHSQLSRKSASRGGTISGLPRFALFATACQFARPPVRIRPVSQPSGTFTSRLPAVRSPSPPLDITTAVAGPLRWWDSRPLERQLDSLHSYVRCRQVENPGYRRGPMHPQLAPCTREAARRRCRASQENHPTKIQAAREALRQSPDTFDAPRLASARRLGRQWSQRTGQ